MIYLVLWFFAICSPAIILPWNDGERQGGDRKTLLSAVLCFSVSPPHCSCVRLSRDCKSVSAFDSADSCRGVTSV